MSDSWTTSNSSTSSLRLPNDQNVEGPSVLDFEPHFDLSAHSVRAVLLQIIEHLSSFRNLHNWDEKLVISPLRTLRAATSRYLTTHLGSNLNFLLSHANVHEVSTVDGTNKTRPVLQESEDIYEHLFFSRVSDRFCLMMSSCTDVSSRFKVAAIFLTTEKALIECLSQNCHLPMAVLCKCH